MRRLISILLASAMVASPALAWDLHKEANSVRTQETIGDSAVALICHRGRDQLEFNLKDLTGGNQNRGKITNVMLWVKLPDGRTDRWPVEVSGEGPQLTGPAYVSDFNLGFFANAESLEVTEATTGELLFRSDMKGTGAARIAFKERCGI